MCESRNSLGTRLEIILLIRLDAYKLLDLGISERDSLVPRRNETIESDLSGNETRMEKFIAASLAFQGHRRRLMSLSG